MTHLSESEIHDTTISRTPEAAAEIENVASYGCFRAQEFEDAIQADVRALRAAKVLGGVEIRGMALDLETGVAREVVVE